MISGILLLDKPAGLSSNAALQRVRRLLGANKAGHVGSLDPLATGMLPICLGEATKVAGDIVAGRKLYRFSVTLGTRTATGDTEGEPVETAPVPTIEAAQLQSVLERFHGRQTQVPPMYSALKRDGQPLYKLARAGIEVERAPREIEIASLRLLTREESVLALEVLCSKGTYVRTLAEDIARALGTCGHVTALRRVYVEPFVDAPMQTLDEITAICEGGRRPNLLAPDEPLRHLAAVSLDVEAARRVRQGQAVAAAEPVQDGRVRLYGAAGEFLGLGEAAHGEVRPRRLLAPGG
ncbi:MAG TPA: tRNA pseudouridine(55) synthase TruB [Steroidobacteraceae bacterium]|nr:tRNA pseudouridine(55) synthase TruB [Steroidobacteraceae bacterium]